MQFPDYQPPQDASSEPETPGRRPLLTDFTALNVPATEDDDRWMGEALALAHRAIEVGEVPVGAVVVLGGRRIAGRHNEPIRLHDPAAHAEVLALRDAAQQLQNYRVVGATLYVTLEPCVMCAGLITHARLSRVVFGAADPKAGAVRSVYDVIARPQLNHAVTWTGGVMEAECSSLLRDFFRQRRLAGKPP
jgi:tRNA(adenine34) deaminase